MEDLFSVVGTEVIQGPEVGKPTGDYTLELNFSGKVLGISKSEAEAILFHALKVQQGEKDLEKDYKIEDFKIQVQNYKPDDDEAGVIISANMVY